MHDFGPRRHRLVHAAQRAGQVRRQAERSYQFIDFHYADYTDVRTGKPYSYKASVLNTVLSATF